MYLSVGIQYNDEQVCVVAAVVANDLHVAVIYYYYSMFVVRETLSLVAQQKQQPRSVQSSIVIRQRFVGL